MTGVQTCALPIFDFNKNLYSINEEIIVINSLLLFIVNITKKYKKIIIVFLVVFLRLFFETHTLIPSTIMYIVYVTEAPIVMKYPSEINFLLYL